MLLNILSMCRLREIGAAMIRLLGLLTILSVVLPICPSAYADTTQRYWETLILQSVSIRFWGVSHRMRRDIDGDGKIDFCRVVVDETVLQWINDLSPYLTDAEKKDKAFMSYIATLKTGNPTQRIVIPRCDLDYQTATVKSLKSVAAGLVLVGPPTSETFARLGPNASISFCVSTGGPNLASGVSYYCSKLMSKPAINFTWSGEWKLSPGTVDGLYALAGVVPHQDSLCTTFESDPTPKPLPHPIDRGSLTYTNGTPLKVDKVGQIACFSTDNESGFLTPPKLWPPTWIGVSDRRSWVIAEGKAGVGFCRVVGDQKGIADPAGGTSARAALALCTQILPHQRLGETTADLLEF